MCCPALGVNLAVDPVRQAEIVEQVGIAFLFAPAHHPAMRHVMPVRQELGCRTIFNILGPLANPAGAQAQVLGVYTPDLTRPMAEVLRILGLSRAMVVHGSGLDEITTTGDTCVCELDKGMVRSYTLNPSSFGITPASLSDLRGGDPQENARIIREILAGEQGACRDIVLMNAGAAIYTGGQARDLHDGIEHAAASIDSGNAGARLDALDRSNTECSMILDEIVKRTERRVARLPSSFPEAPRRDQCQSFSGDPEPEREKRDHRRDQMRLTEPGGHPAECGYGNDGRCPGAGRMYCPFRYSPNPISSGELHGISDASRVP